MGKKPRHWTQVIESYCLCMNAKTADLNKFDQYLDGNWIVDFKEDGTRCSLYIGHHSEEPALTSTMRAFARTISVTDDLPVEMTEKIPHICNQERDYLHGTQLECEIVHAHGFGASREIMGSSVTRALAMQFGEPVSVKKLWQTGDRFKLNALERLEKQRKKDKMPPVSQVTFYENDKGKIDVAPWYGPVEAVVFDIPRYRDVDNVAAKTPLRKRLEQLEAVFHTGPFLRDKHVRQMAHFPAKWAKVLYNLVIKRGGEGLMLKHLDGIYVPAEWQHGKNKLKDSRSAHWRKWKKENTFDVVIVGYTPPKKYSTKVGDDKPTLTKHYINGHIGAVEFGVYDEDDQLIKVGQCSGMDDRTRALLSKKGDKHLGQVIEVQSNFMNASTGALHHPRYVRPRPDKEARDCTFKAHLIAGKGVKRK